MGILLQRLKERRDVEGIKTSENSTQWLIDQIKSPDNTFVTVVTPDKIVPGRLYFLFYDLAAALKSSKLEQYSPILALKKGIVNGKPILWGFSLNFLPERVKVNWFDQLMERFFRGVLTTNISEDKIIREPLKITFEGVYKTLASIGFEYAIREFRLDLINKVYEIDITQLDRFVSIDVQKFTNVDPKKLIEIWLAKLGEGDARLKKIKDNVLTNFKTLDDELNISFEELEKSKNFLNKI
jgi:hypothetical protein